MPRSPHVLSLVTAPAHHESEFGWIRSADADSFPIVERMSLRAMSITPGCFREPHWHANAHELGYLLSGELLVTIFGNGNERSRFTVAPGQMWFAPSGSLHALESTGEEPARIVAAFSSGRVEDFGLSGSVGAMSSSVMGNTWGLAVDRVAGITRSVEDIMIGRATAPAEIVEADRYGSRWRFDVEAMSPPIVNEFGSARTAKAAFWPALRDLSMFSLRIEGDGMREPHWHPETAEMGYVISGRARMTVRSPGADVDTYELGPGDVYFIPPAYPHHIEDLDESQTRFLVFFDQANGQDIGYTGGTAAFDQRVMAATLGVAASAPPEIPPAVGDLLIVRKVNPVAPDA